VSAPGKRWEERAERGALLGLRITVWFYRLLGARLALLVVIPVVTYFFVTDRAGRRASLDYLRRVYATPEGRAALGRPPDWWTSYRHYRSFARTILDRFELWLGREERFHFEIEGREHVRRFIDEKTGGLVLGAHLGSFDALRALARVDRVVVNVAMYTRHATRINQIFRELSPEIELRVIQLDPGSLASVFAIRRCIERGELVALLADRARPGERGRRCRVPFLGSPAWFPQGPIELAAMLGCPVALMLGLRTGGRRYQVLAEPLFERVELPRQERDERAREYVAELARRLERHCLRRPLQWFNFYDFWGESPDSPG
jgi:predicted LPLAT superfamily acyltransferase